MPWSSGSGRQRADGTAMETFLASIGWLAVRLLRRHGVDAQELFRETGFVLNESRDPAARIPSHVADIVISRAAKLIDDPAFALHAARCWHPSDLGVLGYAWLSSSTLRTGLQRMVRYRRILATTPHTRQVQQCHPLQGTAAGTFNFRGRIRAKEAKQLHMSRSAGSPSKGLPSRRCLTPPVRNLPCATWKTRADRSSR